MALSGIIAQIDAEIATLQQARAVLTGAPSAAPKNGRGRPKGSKNAKAAKAAPAKASAAAPTAAGKRKLSPEGRKRIADAMKKRWADRRKQVAKS